MKGIFLNGTRCFTSHIELQALPMPWLQTQKSLGALLLNLESSMCVFQHGSGSKSLRGGQLVMRWPVICWLRLFVPLLLLLLQSWSHLLSASSQRSASVEVYALFAMGSHVLPHIARFNKSFLANLSNLTLRT